MALGYKNTLKTIITWNRDVRAFITSKDLLDNFLSKLYVMGQG